MNPKYIIILLFLVLNHFFGAFPMSFSITVPILLFCLYMGWKQPTDYRKIFLVIFVGILASMVSCMINRGQSIIDSIKAMPNYFGLLFYFFLKWRKFKLTTVQSALVWLIIVFDILYIAQYYLIDYGINFLNIDDWMLSDSTEGNRLRVMSSGLYSLGMFYGIVQWYITHKNKYLALFIVGAFVMLLTGYRQFLVSTLVALLFMIYKLDKRVKLKHIGFVAAIVVVGYFLYQIPAVQGKIAGMIERNDTGASLDNKDYIRVIQWEFFNHEYFKNGWEHFFGSGLPLPGAKSGFGKYFQTLTDQGLQYVDWGIIGVSWMLGVLTFVGYVWMSLAAILKRVPSVYLYISLWYIFLLSSSITNWEFFRDGNFLVHAMALYIIELASKENEKNKSCLLLK